MGQYTTHSHRVYFKSAEELETIKIEALRDGVKNTSTWIRDIVISEIRRRRAAQGAATMQQLTATNQPTPIVPIPAQIWSAELGRHLTLDEAANLLLEAEAPEESPMDLLKDFTEDNKE